MRIKHCIELSAAALKVNRTRSLLASLGIMIGIASVIVMVAIGKGSQEDVMDLISKMGENLITVSAGEMQRRAASLQLAGNISNLSTRDVHILLTDVPELEKAAPFVSKPINVKFGDATMSVTVSGSTPDFLSVRKYEVERGRFFDDRDVRTANRVAVLGATTVKNIFGVQDPLGQTVRAGTVPVTVIGIFKSKGLDIDGQDQDDIAILPLTTVMRRILNQKYINTIYLEAKTKDVMDQAAAKAHAALREQHKLKENAEDDFMLQSQLDLERLKQGTSEMFTALIVGVAAISLVVGGVGILAVMLISVKERTREIGLRRAVGASRRDIIQQFLTESLLIGFLGGVIGIALGVLVTLGTNAWGTSRLILDHKSIVLSTVVCVVVGIVFGVYPAIKASRLDPMDALRVE